MYHSSLRLPAFLALLPIFTTAAIAQQPGAPKAPPESAPTAPAATPPKNNPLAGVKPLRNLTYATPDDKPVKLDLFLPEGATKPTPLIIWIHGGGWQAGSKAWCPALPWCKDGFAVCSVEYRFTDVAPFPAQIHDCKAAVRFLRANAAKYNLDPDRFGCWGASAGGHLVALLGTTCGEKDEEGNLGCNDQSSAVQCVCDWFGPTDFASMPPQDDTAPMITALFGGRPSEKPDLVKLASPLLHVTKNDPPFLIVQGDQDPLVPEQQSKVLADALKAAGVPTELVIVPNGGHGNFGDRQKAEFDRVHDFFVKQLKPAPLAKLDSTPETKTEPSPDPKK